MIPVNDLIQLLLMKKRVKLEYDTSKWKEVYKPYFNTLLMFITDKCNLGCPECFNSCNLYRFWPMTFEYAKMIIDVNTHIEKYDVMGGEPLLHEDLDKFLTYLEDQGKQVGLYTNGMFLQKRLRRDYRSLRINMAFHCIESPDKLFKPISVIAPAIKEFQYIYPMKIVFLMVERNKHLLYEFADYVVHEFPAIDKLTIGAIRDESDYYNDGIENIVPLIEYGEIVQEFAWNYKGRLNIDIFTEGLLYTDNLPKTQPKQLNRFKAVYIDNQMVSCIYDIGLNHKVTFNPSKPIVYPDCASCPRTGKLNCLTDKIKLVRI